MKLHFLETEWSDIILLQDNKHFALIDTGFDGQYQQILDYLHKLGAKKLDFILITHFHRDHYGSLPMLVSNFPVDTVYLKEYSGLDSTTSYGTPADDAYRAAEMQKYNDYCKLIAEKSTLVHVETISSIPFGAASLKLYNNENVIRRVYEDDNYPDTYHKMFLTENLNSLVVYMVVDHVKILLCGDLLDYPASHPAVNYAGNRIAKQISTDIDIYKVPHHGTVNTGIHETLAIYRPRIAVITNTEDYITNSSDVLFNLKTVNPRVKVHITRKGTVVLNTKELY